jgi:hypothetical protein
MKPAQVIMFVIGGYSRRATDRGLTVDLDSRETQSSITVKSGQARKTLQVIVTWDQHFNDVAITAYVIDADHGTNVQIAFGSSGDALNNDYAITQAMDSLAA